MCRTGVVTYTGISHQLPRGNNAVMAVLVNGKLELFLEPSVVEDINRVVRHPDFQGCELTARILLVSAIVGPKDDLIAALLRVPRNQVRARGKVLRKNGVWRRGVVRVNWFEGDDGTLNHIDLLLDCMVADGYLERQGWG